ncbi:MAG: helicase associated domain-containing protein, partial [Lachnospiraceae bacterium]|nr:helicase associated domain-containing protein [Lachnospiraceae bacterium]
RLTKAQIGKLDAIGMVWESRADVAWARNYGAAKRYYREHGNLNVPYDYVSPGGVNLGDWLRSLRRWRNAGAHQNYLTPERIGLLDAIGMVWDKQDYYWECNYRVACDYYKEHGDLDVPYNYVTEDGVRLGNWIYRLRAARSGQDTKDSDRNTGRTERDTGENGRNPEKHDRYAKREEKEESCGQNDGKECTDRRKARTQLTEDQIRRLDAIGMIWEDRNEVLWDKYFDAARSYYQEHGNIDVPQKYETNGMKLGSWVNRQKVVYRAGKLPERRAKKLESLGVSAALDAWKEKIALARRYMTEQNVRYVAQDVVVDGFWLGKWLAAQRKALEAGELSTEQEQYLQSMPLYTKSEIQWEDAYAQAAEYYKTHGDLDVPRRYISATGYGLGSWVSYQKQQRRKGKLSAGQIQRLDEIGFEWGA